MGKWVEMEWGSGCDGMGKWVESAGGGVGVWNDGVVV